MTAVQQAISQSIKPASHTICSSEELGELRQQAHWLSHMLNVMPSGVIVLDGTGRVKTVNQLAIDLLGEPLQGELWRNVIARVFRPQPDDGHEISLVNGRRVKLSLSSLHPEPGQLIVLTDLTETRQLQTRISHMQRLSSLGRMVASLAHQIRTPLSAAILYTENLLSGNLSSQQSDNFTGKLSKRLHELEHQVNDMLLFAKSGDNTVLTTVSVKQVVEQAVTVCQETTEQKGCKLALTCVDGDCLIKGNGAALSGAIQNLINNAVQASDVGMTVLIEVKAVSESVVVTVKDTGKGISQSLQKTMFQPFVTDKTHGTGLGLAVVESVIKAHHGSIDVGSEEGKGSCFTIALPLVNDVSGVVS